MSVSVNELREILLIFADSNLQDLRLQIGETRMEVSKNDQLGSRPTTFMPAAPPSVTAAAAAAVPAASNGSEHPPAEEAPVPSAGSDPVPAGEAGHRVLAPTVGVFYRRAAPDKPPYVEVGDVVAAGDPVCTLEVMKMFTEVTAEVSGRVVEILVGDGEAVEFGQALVVIEPGTTPS